jgi:small-conductance mechanosensitive channel/CRP-like cAMP-binding protein
VNQYLGIANAVLAGLVIFLVAGAVATPLRRRLGGRRASGNVILRSLGNVAGFLLRPLFVLALTQLALWLLGSQSFAVEWLERYARAITAWQLFWLGVLILALLEGLARQFYVLRDRDFPIPDLLFGIIHGLLVLAVAFAVLRLEMGVNIAPLLASTALITAVVGFALQGVLGNLLAGMSLHIVKTIVPGDWAIIGDVEGKVLQTNWRETRVRSRDGHLLIVPNSKVSESLINNLVRPTPQRRHRIHVGASYADAPDEVIAALLSAARSVPEVLPHPAPEAFITEYQDFGINYRLRFWTTQYYRRVPIEGDVCRMIWYEFKRRGIEIPFPMSDQLLNDFMAVVYHQRHLQPEQRELDDRVTDLMRSDFHTKLCVDPGGAHLLKQEDYEKIVPSVRRVLFTRGETLFRQGDAGDIFYVLIKGKLKGKIEHEKAAPATEFDIGPGAVLGEMSLMTGLPRTASIAVTESAELLEFDANAFGRVLALHEDIPRVLSDLAAARAAENAAAFERLKQLQGEKVSENLKPGNILKRFLRMISGGTA